MGMYELRLDKKYAIGFSNFGLQWTTLKKEEKQQIKDAIWIQGSGDDALERKVAERAAKEISNFLKLRHSEIHDNGVLILSIQTKPASGQTFMNKAKYELIENELDDAKKERLTENLIVSEYFRSEDDLLSALEENNHMWEKINISYQDIPC